MEQEKKDFALYLKNLRSKIGQDEMEKGTIKNINELDEKRNKIKIFLNDMIEIKKKYNLYIDETKRYKKISDEGIIKDNYKDLIWYEKKLYKDYFETKFKF